MTNIFENMPSSLLIYFCLQLHHVGAPFSQPIAPVTYMWKPFHGWDGEDNANCDAAVGSNAIECHSCFRQIWLWIHASAFNEGYDALRLASQKQVKNTTLSLIRMCI